MTVTYTPVVVVLPADDIAAVRATPHYLAATETLNNDPRFALLMRVNGWTADMLILGGFIKTEPIEPDYSALDRGDDYYQ